MGEYSNINFKKKFGQNFLSDTNLLISIVHDADITNQDTVVEIGAGAGALTAQLVKVAKKVIAFEIDNELQDLLKEKFKENNNIEFVFEDFMNYDLALLSEKIEGNFKVVANLPYYITTPIITKLFEMKNKPQTIVVMVQKEVGERMIATEKKGDYGYFSVYVKANANAKITRPVNRKMFTPMPNVDSCVVRLDLHENQLDNKFFEFLKACFLMKRKTLANNLNKALSIPKQQTEAVLEKVGLNGAERADNLALEQLISVYNELFDKNV